jgi:hypothetical protein
MSTKSKRIEVRDFVEFTKAGHAAASKVWPWLEDPKKWETHLESRYEVVQAVKPPFQKRTLFIQVPGRDEPIAVWANSVKRDCREWRARMRMSKAEKLMSKARINEKIEAAL